LETKEQFSDGVGYSWIDTLKEVVAVEVSDEQLANANINFLANTNIKKEYYYRSIFHEHFPSELLQPCVYHKVVWRVKRH
jgi:asparagine synthase (glutamine-hydrolysing)